MSGLYVKLDVNYFDDPKVTSVSTDAEVLFVRSLCYCKRLLSDGYIAVSQLRRLASDIGTDSDSESLAKELTSVGLWNDEPGGWRIAAWASHNDLAEEVEEKRKAKQEGGVLGNHKRWHQGKKGTPSDDCRYCQSHTDRSTDQTPTPLPSPETEVETETEEEQSSDAASGADPVTKFGQQAVDLARHLGNRVQANGHKVPAKGSKNAWAWFADVEKLLRIDGADPGEVRAVIDWATSDDFWRANMRSANKLREKYSQLRLQMLRVDHRSAPDPTATTDLDEYGTSQGVV